jgi:hypothetical protein
MATKGRGTRTTMGLSEQDLPDIMPDNEDDDPGAVKPALEPTEQDDDPEETQALVTGLMRDAIEYYEENIEPGQVSATQFYHGERLGRLAAREGYSKVVDTAVRDATLQQMPSIMDVLFGPEDVVEFAARHASAKDIARQQTDFINWVVREENEGFLEYYSAIKDALVRGLGIFKWWYETQTNRVVSYHYDVPEIGLAFLEEDGAQVEPIKEGAEPGTWDVKVTREESGGCIRFAAVPNEEFVFTPRARSLKGAAIVAHVREESVATAVELGFSEELAQEKMGRRRVTNSDESLDTARNRDTSSDGFNRRFGEVGDDDMQPVVVTEAYVRKGDRIFKYMCLGDDFEIDSSEEVDEVNFAVITPDPEAHTIIGLGNYDLLEEVQVVRTELKRRMLDSLAQAIEPTLGVGPGVNMQDVLDPEISGIIRFKTPGTLQPIEHTFVGQQVLGVLAYYDQVQEDATGTSRAAKGLDADALQSSTKAAVMGTFTMSQQRIKMICRIFAEMGLKRLYKGMLRLAIKYPNHRKVMRLRGEVVEVDPRYWDADMDVRVNVGLGYGTAEEQMKALAAIAAEQKEQMSSGSPLVTFVEYRNTLERMTRKLGFVDSTEFFKAYGVNEEQQAQQAAAQQPKQPDPAQQLVEIERMKVQSQASLDMMKMQLEEMKMLHEDMRERQRIANDATLREMDIEAKNHVELEDRKVRRSIEANKHTMELDLRREIEQQKLEAAAAAQQQTAAPAGGGAETS